MMDREDRDSQQSRKLRQELMTQLRDARRRIDPELLAYARKIIERTSGGAPAEKPLPPDMAFNPPVSLAMPRQMRSGKKPAPSSALLVDRQKNMATILKFLKLTSHNKRLGQRVQALFPNQQGS